MLRRYSWTCDDDNEVGVRRLAKHSPSGGSLSSNLNLRTEAECVGSTSQRQALSKTNTFRPLEVVLKNDNEIKQSDKWSGALRRRATIDITFHIPQNKEAHKKRTFFLKKIQIETILLKLVYTLDLQSRSSLLRRR